MIVWPKTNSAATQIHLFLADYQPGKRSRSVPSAALCGQPAHMYWEKLADGYRDLPQAEWTTVTTATGRWHQPFVEGFEFVKDPWSFCPICMGRAIQHLGLRESVARLIAAHIALT